MAGPQRVGRSRTHADRRARSVNTLFYRVNLTLGVYAAHLILHLLLLHLLPVDHYQPLSRRVTKMEMKISHSNILWTVTRALYQLTLVSLQG
jgi:hypothetical protein